MRASSWGDVGEYGRLLRAHEAASMHSGAGDGEHEEEPLDPDVVVLGAGGVAHAPLPPTPSGSAGLLAALAVPPSSAYNVNATCHVPQVVSSYSSEGDADASDADSDSFFARNSEDAAVAAAAARGAFSHAHQHHLHPHMHPHPHAGYGDEDDGDGDGGWGFNNGIGTERRAKSGMYGPSVEECDYGEEDEDEDEGSDGPAIEVRRRRPSWAGHHDEHHEGDDEDDEDERAGHRRRRRRCRRCRLVRVLAMMSPRDFSFALFRFVLTVILYFRFFSTFYLVVVSYLHTTHCYHYHSPVLIFFLSPFSLRPSFHILFFYMTGDAICM